MTWKKENLADVAEIVMGQSPDSSFYNSESAGMPFLQGCAEFGKQFPKSQIFSSQIKKIGKQGSILFSVRAPVGKINVADKNYCIGRGLSAITGKKIDQIYLLQFFNFAKDSGGFSSQGSTFESINSDELGKIKVSFPEEEIEQRRIAEILSTADEAIEQTQALIDKYNRIKRGLMQDLLTRGIDENGNIRSKKTHKFTVKNGIEVPDEWDVDSLDTLIKAVDPQPDHRTPMLVENGVPYLGINDVNELGVINYKKCRKVSQKILVEHRARYTINDGDIIFGKIGTIGEPKKLKAFDHITLSANLILIQPKETPDFVFWVLKSEDIENQIANSIHSTSQPAFGMEKIRALKIPIPKKEEREKIGKILNQAELNLLAEKKKLVKFQSIKKGLMQDLLSGKVRVKIDE